MQLRYPKFESMDQSQRTQSLPRLVPQQSRRAAGLAECKTLENHKNPEQLYDSTSKLLPNALVARVVEGFQRMKQARLLHAYLADRRAALLDRYLFAILVETRGFVIDTATEFGLKNVTGRVVVRAPIVA